VHRAQGEARAGALYFDRMDRQVPMGSAATARRCILNADFLDGSRGAHVSISGISGVATKTSFATFLLYSVLPLRRARRRRRDRQHPALIFNVKGEDLLFLDHPNTSSTRPRRATRGSACRRAVPRRAGLRPAAGRRLVRHAPT
jgi:DNA helicase HerA-like ATPase